MLLHGGNVPGEDVYSLSPFSPASDVTVMVKVVGSSESTAAQEQEEQQTLNPDQAPSQ